MTDIHRPKWYREGKTLVINSETCGINKDGHEQYLVDLETGVRRAEINDKLSEACEDVIMGKFDNSDVNFHLEKEINANDIYVPEYYDKTITKEIELLCQKDKNLSLMTFSELLEKKYIEIKKGHGSPSSDQRLGEIPYIKVSDLRAGTVNINPTNMIPAVLAKKFWRSNSSGLKSYDLISPERASKNIGEFCILMPWQENIVLTKEVIVIRATKEAPFNQFYLMWALSLSCVRRQWNRIIFMQTNREDVGSRMLEISIPIAKSQEYASKLSAPFYNFYTSFEKERNKFLKALRKSKFEHYIHLGDK